jgi:DNA excision repair protein ERCC-2
MDMKDSTIKVSVKNLVEFVLAYGDLESGFASSTRNTDAIKIHQKLQKSAGEGYLPEITLRYTVKKDDYKIEISGRADGIIENSTGVTIDEIKTTNRELQYIEEDHNILHWAQAKCYAFIYATQRSLENINVQLTYYHMESGDIKRFNKSLSFQELEDFFAELIEKYIYWSDKIMNWTQLRNMSISNLEFPFSNYRKGQRDMAVKVYRTVRDKGILFAEAPTGTGKTMAAAFPAVKAMGEGYTDKIFYLTAKTIARTTAEDTFMRLREKGLKIKTITLTAKDKICFMPDAKCNAEECDYAKGYYDRLKGAVDDISKEENMTRDIVMIYAKLHNVCPFEFSLELSNWCDCIICDYNYVFDPRVYLKRFFLEGGEYTLLVDEAHNLVDRAREMFSAELLKKEIMELKKDTKDAAPKIHKILSKINTSMIELKKKCSEEGNLVSKELPTELLSHLRRCMEICEKWLLDNEKDILREKILDFYFKVNAFTRTSEMYDEKYVTYAEETVGDFKLKLFCLDPSKLLRDTEKKVRAAIFFSATLTPMDYYLNILGGDEGSLKSSLPSPFPRENLQVLVNDSISTLYKDRENTYKSITESINVLASIHKGNYLIFFPSYAYMERVYSLMPEDNENIMVIKQETSMSEEDRERFLQEFHKFRENTLLGFAVMGGIFGEGIDLSGEKLCGAVIVGVGLPKLCLERDIIQKHFADENGLGFEYAYVYPGINKVMQAAGRVIRTETDRGVVVLIDKRFIQGRYSTLLPKSWMPLIRVHDHNGIKNKVVPFWNEIY